MCCLSNVQIETLYVIRRAYESKIQFVNRRNNENRLFDEFQCRFIIRINND